MIPARIVVTLVALVLVVVPGSSRASAQETEKQTAPDPPKVQAAAWALVDAETGLYLAGKNPDKRLPIASTTKIMTALLALEEGGNLNEKVTVSAQAERYVGSIYSNIGLIKGERLSVKELLEAALVPSGTEAVY